MKINKRRCIGWKGGETEGGRKGENVSSRCCSGNLRGDVLSPFLLTKAKWIFL